jgi:hypothetical protein
MSLLRQAWDRVWFRRFDPLSVGAFRICLGGLLFVYYAALYPNWERFYGADGLLSLDATDPTRKQRPWLSVFTWTEGVVPVGVFWWVGVVAAVGLALGWRSRLWAALLFVLHTSMMMTNRWLIIGDDIVWRMLLFLGLFAPLGDRLSVDAWLQGRRDGGKAADESTWPTIWAVRLMQVNIAIVYLFSVPRKLAVNPDWLDGTAVYWILLNDTWGRWPWPSLFYGTGGEILSALATFGTILIEGAFPLLVWFRPLRMYVLAAATALHLGIALTMHNVVFFQFAMICSFWLFVPAEVTRRWGQGLARLFGRERAAPREVPSTSAVAGPP